MIRTIRRPRIYLCGQSYKQMCEVGMTLISHDDRTIWRIAREGEDTLDIEPAGWFRRFMVYLVHGGEFDQKNLTLLEDIKGER